MSFKDHKIMRNLIKFKAIIVIALMAVISSCSESKSLETVKNFDVKKYQGVWYEIGKLPNRFEEGLECVTAEYTLLKNGDIKVVNKGRVEGESEEMDIIEGKAWVPDSEYPAQLKVEFFWPFSGDYYIIQLDQEYQWALVGSPNRKFLWVLSKDKNMDEKFVNKLLQKASASGFDISKFEYVNQECQN